MSTTPRAFLLLIQACLRVLHGPDSKRPWVALSCHHCFWAQHLWRWQSFAAIASRGMCRSGAPEASKLLQKRHQYNWKLQIKKSAVHFSNIIYKIPLGGRRDGGRLRSLKMPWEACMFIRVLHFHVGLFDCDDENTMTMDSQSQMSWLLTTRPRVRLWSNVFAPSCNPATSKCVCVCVCGFDRVGPSYPHLYQTRTTEITTDQINWILKLSLLNLIMALFKLAISW